MFRPSQLTTTQQSHREFQLISFLWFNLTAEHSSLDIKEVLNTVMYFGWLELWSCQQVSGLYDTIMTTMHWLGNCYLLHTKNCFCQLWRVKTSMTPLSQVQASLDWLQLSQDVKSLTQRFSECHIWLIYSIINELNLVVAVWTGI